MTDGKSDTPRTEIHVLNQQPQAVPADFARQLERENAKLRKGLEAVETLIHYSGGVTGIHVTGDAPWDELRTGGRCDGWLKAFDEALEVKGEQ